MQVTLHQLKSVSRREYRVTPGPGQYGSPTTVGDWDTLTLSDGNGGICVIYLDAGQDITPTLERNIATWPAEPKAEEGK